MPAPARKTPAKKTASKPNPAEAAVKEALNEGDVEFNVRGQKFVMKASTRSSFDYAMAIASGNDAQIIYELVSPEDRQRLFALKRYQGEPFVDIATDFFEGLAQASGEGNS